MGYLRICDTRVRHLALLAMGRNSRWQFPFGDGAAHGAFACAGAFDASRIYLECGRRAP
jgi:hypothetical protein